MKFSVSAGHFECDCGVCSSGQTVDERDLPPDTRGDDRPDARTSDTLSAWSSQTNGEYAESDTPNASGPGGVFSKNGQSGSESASSRRGSKRTGPNYVGQGGPSARSTDSPSAAKRDDRPGPVLTRSVDDDGGDSS